MRRPKWMYLRGLSESTLDGHSRDAPAACRQLSVFKAHRPLYDSTMGLRVIKKKKKVRPNCGDLEIERCRCEDRFLDGPASGEKGSKGGSYKYCNPRT